MTHHSYANVLRESDLHLPGPESPSGSRLMNALQCAGSLAPALHFASAMCPPTSRFAGVLRCAAHFATLLAAADAPVSAAILAMQSVVASAPAAWAAVLAAWPAAVALVKAVIGAVRGRRTPSPSLPPPFAHRDLARRPLARSRHSVTRAQIPGQHPSSSRSHWRSSPIQNSA